ncbi:MAG: amino acid adenylation domain-containing protein, partial [Gammaproteobacteria bacterium]
VGDLELSSSVAAYRSEVAGLPDIGAVEFPDQNDTASLITRFESQVAEHPHRPAVQSALHTWTYRELNQRVNGVAQELLAACGTHKQRVGLLLGHDALMVAGLLGALKAGKAYVPLDPEAPIARLRQWIEGADIAALVSDATNRNLARKLMAAGVALIEVDSEGRRVPDPDIDIAADDLAYILFTSGSTGRPKGVMQTHANVMQHVRAYTRSIRIQAGDRLSLFSRYGFDAAVMDIFGALLNGACLVPVDLRGEQRFGAACQQLREAHTTVLHVTPTVFRYLMQQASGACLDTVRTVVLGGETALKSDFELFRQNFVEDAVFVNGLGPSESTLALQFFANRNTEIKNSSMPVGCPVEGARVTLLDKAGRPGAFHGEIAISSEALTPGYWNEPELTRAAFKTMPDGTQFYLTGDRAYRQPDGCLVFLGRSDAQIKIRGYKIEPGEVSACLCAHAGVQQAAVELYCDIPGADRLVAYVVKRGTSSVSGTALREHLQESLPDYMIPAVVLFVDALPLLANGKLDRRALPVPEFSSEDSYIAPRSPLEETLAGIWADLLQVGRVGVVDDFFALGGHSLLATQLVSRIRDVLQIELALRQLFDAPTVARLAETLSGVVASDATKPAGNITPLAVGETGELPPLSYAQQRLWFLDQLEPGSAAYNLHWAAELHGALDEWALRSALEALVARHDSLRTTFASQNAEPVQVIASHMSVDIEHEVLSGASDARIRARLIEISRQPFDLLNGPLLRVVLLRRSSTDHVLFLLMHHIVSDGWSMGVLFRELTELYQGCSRGEIPDMPGLPVQYKDYAIWQRNWLSGSRLEQQSDYWRAQLSDAPLLLEMPADRPRPAVQRYRGAWSVHRFSPGLHGALKSLAKRESSTLFMVLLAAFNVLLARHVGREDILVGTPVAGRQRTELEALIGYFLNTLVLRTDLSGNPSFAELLARVRQLSLQAFEHQDLPFEKLLEILQPARNTAYTPIVQVTFNLHNEPAQKLSLAGLDVMPFAIDRGTSKFDLSLSVIEGESGLSAGFEYNTDLFDEETVGRWLLQFERLLESATENPQACIGAMPLESAQPPNTFFEQIPAAEFPLSALKGSLVERFEEQVARYPHNPAVDSVGFRWTYAELNARANAVAHELIAACGTADGQRVGLLLGHDALMVAGLMGALKAGKTYVPLDPNAPPARLEEWVANAGLSAVVADAHNRELARALMHDGVALIEVSNAASTLPNPDLSIDPGELAYILFTSGTTGKPKGVMQTHRNVLHHIRAYSRSVHINSRDRLSLFSMYGFDAAVMDIFGALLNGACLCPMD